MKSLNITRLIVRWYYLKSNNWIVDKIKKEYDEEFTETMVDGWAHSAGLKVKSSSQELDLYQDTNRAWPAKFILIITADLTLSTAEIIMKLAGEGCKKSLAAIKTMISVLRKREKEKNDNTA